MPEEKVSSVQIPSNAGELANNWPAADAGPRQPELGTCWLNEDGHGGFHEKSDRCSLWRTRGDAAGDVCQDFITAAPPVPQEAAPQPISYVETAPGIWQGPEYQHHRDPQAVVKVNVTATAPDWAMRVAERCVRLANGYASDAGILDSDELTVGIADLIRQAGSDEITKLKQELADLRAQRYENMDEFRFRGKTAAELTELIARGQAGSERERPTN